MSKTIEQLFQEKIETLENFKKTLTNNDAKSFANYLLSELKVKNGIILDDLETFLQYGGVPVGEKGTHFCLESGKYGLDCLIESINNPIVLSYHFFENS